ncbi:MAG: MgtC/SapB family protein [Candidatus Brocadiae bacterium]|nr:MgtC/SapB family protein [Candidatus Brocadiia bacterium]
MFDTPEGMFFFRGGVALLLGLSLGLEREKSGQAGQSPHFAGIRTFSLCALTGFLCATIDGTALLVAGFAASALLATAAWLRPAGATRGGMTTEAAFLLTYLLGAACGRGLILQACVVAIAATSLLAWRERLHGFARALPAHDYAAAVKFAVISIVILPLIPNRDYGSGWWAVNFHKTWLMVVLISGLGFGGYILTRIVGPRTGTGLAGLLGGLVSSTAVTLSFSKRSREVPSLAAACSLAIVAACTVLYLRVAIEAVVIHPEFARALAFPLGALFLFSTGACAVLYRVSAAAPADPEPADPAYRNPVELFPAIKFAALFAAVTVLFRLARATFGRTGAWVAAFLSGLTNMDAITLSVAEMTRKGTVPMSSAVTSVMLAAIANTLVKAGIALALAGPVTRRHVAVSLGATCALSVAILLWQAFAP